MEPTAPKEFPQAMLDLLSALRIRLEVLEDAFLMLGTMITREDLDKQFHEKWVKFKDAKEGPTGHCGKKS